MTMPERSSRRRAIARLFWVSAAAVACATSEPLQTGDRDVLVTLRTLAEFGLELPEDYERHESFERERVIDGTILLEYEYESPDGGPPFVYSSAELHPSPGDACLSYSAGNLGVRLGGLELEEADHLFHYGDKSRFALIENEGTPIGNLFAMCRSRTAVLLMFVGLYFDDAATWHAFISPSLRALEALEATHPGR